MEMKGWEKTARELSKDAGEVERSKAKGDNWCRKATPVLVGIGNFKKSLKTAKDAATEVWRGKIKEIEGPVKKVMEEIEVHDCAIRERVMEEHEGHGTVTVEEIGELVFQKKWTYVVEDMEKVPREYMAVDHQRMMEEIKGGVREIPGIKVYQDRVLSVRRAESEKE